MVHGCDLSEPGGDTGCLRWYMVVIAEPAGDIGLPRRRCYLVVIFRSQLATLSALRLMWYMTVVCESQLAALGSGGT